MSDTICDTCNKSFSTKYNLSVHKKTSKSCVSNTEKTSYGCEHCEKEFTTSSNLQKHINTCKDKKLKDKYDHLLKEKELEYVQIIKEKEIYHTQTLKDEKLYHAQAIKEKDAQINNKNNTISSLQVELKTTKEYLEKQVKDLQDRIERLTNKVIETSGPGTTNNKTINNNIVVNNFFTQDYIDKKVKDNFSLTHLLDGVRGVAKFTLEHIIKKDDKMLYVCTDSARQVFYFIASDGTKTRDFKGIKLLNALQKPICEKSLKIIKDADDSIEELSKSNSRNDKQERELKLCNYAMDLWTCGDLSTELSSLGVSGFTMELSKLTSV